MATRAVTVNDVLDGHVGLDLECFDRIYLNGWVPTLQVPGQVVGFLTRHLGFPIPSPAVVERIGLGFRKAVVDFAAEHDIPVVRFTKGAAQGGGDAPAPGLADPSQADRGGGDRGGAGVSAGVHRDDPPRR
jgi:hypothetical protein